MPESIGAASLVEAPGLHDAMQRVIEEAASGVTVSAAFNSSTISQ